MDTKLLVLDALKKDGVDEAKANEYKLAAAAAIRTAAGKFAPVVNAHVGVVSDGILAGVLSAATIPGVAYLPNLITVEMLEEARSLA